jgi:RecQ family ATP-dependent DNA helicase
MLGMNEPIVIRASFDRPNLYIKVLDIPKIGKKLIKKDKLVVPYIKKYNNEKIIVYINSRKDTEELADSINKSLGGNIASAYHAGLSKNDREDVQSKFSSGIIKIIIATIAFGMGIDQTVRCVLVIGAPSSLEEYYQQIGRGGRDGLQCETVLYFDYSKIIIGEYMLKKECNDPNLYRVKSGHLKRVKNFAYNNECRRKYILNYFGEKYMADNCNNCDNCYRITNIKPPSPKKETFEDKINKYSAFLV